MKPVAFALPRTKEKTEAGMYGSLMPKTPPNKFTIIAGVKPGQVEKVRAYAEYPDATGVEVVKALKVKQALSDMLDQIQ